MQFSNTDEYKNLGFQPVIYADTEDGEGTETKHYLLDAEMIARIHKAQFVAEDGSDIDGLWIVPRGLSVDPMVVKAVVHPEEEVSLFTDQMDIMGAASIDSLTLRADGQSIQVFPQIHAMQMPLKDGNVVTVYILLGLVAVSEDQNADDTAALLANVANLNRVEDEGNSMWLDEKATEHYATHAIFETNPTQVIIDFLTKHALLDSLVTPDLLELGSDAEG